MRHRFCTVKYDADPRGGSFLTSLGLPWGSFGDFCSYRATTVFYGVGSWRGHPAGRVGRVISYTYYLLILFAYLLNYTDYSLILFAYLHNLNVLLAFIDDRLLPNAGLKIASLHPSQDGMPATLQSRQAVCGVDPAQYQPDSCHV